jgi:hypothetical protein
LFQLLNSSESTVVLSRVDLSSSGLYKCEVSAEAPSFQTVSERGQMIVVGEYAAVCRFNSFLVNICEE